jgi:predicted transposase YdaD
MGRKWDSIVKRLIGTHPGQYASWLLTQALAAAQTVQFLATLNIELEARHLLADGLLKVLIDGKEAILHLEFQSERDDTIGRRMLEYNLLAEHQYGLPVCSIVVYLRKRAVIPTPHVCLFLDGGVTYTFHFRVIELWEQSAQAILDLGLEGLLPLLPLTKGGKQREIIEIMIDRLKGDRDLLALAEMVGGLAFTDEAEKTWFKRRFAVFQDILKDSWVYQELKQTYEEQGLQQGLQRGLQQGLQRGLEQGLQSHRQAVVEIVTRRFPELVELASQQVAQQTNLERLRVLLVDIASAANLEAARALLLQAGE